MRTAFKQYFGLSSWLPRAGALYGTYEAFARKVRSPSDALAYLKSSHQQLKRVARPPLCELNSSRMQVPGIYKIRYVGQTTLSSAAVRLTLNPSYEKVADCYAQVGQCEWAAKRS